MPPQSLQPLQPSPPSRPLAAPGLEPSRPRSSRLRWILGGLVLLAVVGGAGSWVYRTYLAPKPNATVLKKLSQPSLTAASLQSVDKDEAFYAYLQHAAQRSSQTMTKAFYSIDEDGKQSSNTFEKIGIDYRTKHIVYARDQIEFDGGRSRMLCHDGQEDSYNALIKEWSHEADSTSCRPTQLYGKVTDGFNAGGLTASQADKFVSYLRDHPGLFVVKGMELSTHASKQYVHFSVTLNQIQVKDTFFAAQWLMFAFKKTGLDPESYPYGYVGAGGQGFGLEYYVDPATSLPAYSEIASMPVKDEAGKTIKSAGYRYRQQYDFASGTFDAAPASAASIAITW